MFTGIIEEMGTVKSIRKSANSAILTIGATKVLEETKIGDSIGNSKADSVYCYGTFFYDIFKYCRGCLNKENSC